MRVIVALMLAAVGGPASAWMHGSDVVPVTTGGLLMNIGGLRYFAGHNDFLNWWQVGDVIGLTSTINGGMSGKTIWDCPTKCGTPKTYFDTNTGELVKPMPADVTSIGRGVFTPVINASDQYAATSFNNFARSVWDVTWDGCATPTMSTTGSLGSGGTATWGSNSGQITLGSSPLNVAIIFTFTGIAACYSDPPHNIKVYQHQYAANVARGEVFNPDWINDIKQFGILRLMDWAAVNNGGITDISQLADINYNSLQTAFVSAIASNSTVSGNVLTVSGTNTGFAPFSTGQAIYCQGCVNGSIITGQTSGTPGQDGTYTLSASFTQSSSTAVVGVPSVGSNQNYGPKGGIHPSIACAIANRAGVNIEYPFPFAASDAMVTAVATYFKGCLNPGLKVKYSYGNENWNFTFIQYHYTYSQPSSPARGTLYSGYRAAQVMELIYNVYGAGQRSRWIGALGSQFGNTQVTQDNIDGANIWVSGGATHTLAQLVDQIDVAPYFGPYVNDSWDTVLGALATQSATLNASTPATYPNKYSYYIQQFSKMILTGSATGAYGTISMSGQDIQGLSGAAGTIQPTMEQHALIANGAGVKLGEYEGGLTTLRTGGVAEPNQITEYRYQYQFNAGVVGDAVNTPSNIYATVFQTLRDAHSSYSAQFNDLDPQAGGPWGSARFIPGDESNPKWQALVAENALGPYVDPTGAATGTFAYAGAGTNRYFAQNGCGIPSGCTDTFTPTVGTAPTLLIVAYTLTGGNPGTLTCDGVVMHGDVVYTPAANRVAAIYSGIMGIGTATRSCSMVYADTTISSQFRTMYAMTATGLASNSVQTTAVSSGASVAINETKGAFIVGISACSGNYNTSSGVASGATSVKLADTEPTGGTGSVVVLAANFSSTIFAANHNCSGSQAAATYR
jgi:hypothetical protein